MRYHERDTNPTVIADWEYIDEYRIAFKEPENYDQSSLYEFTFPAKDPVVYGLGFASIRDVVSFLRYEKNDDKDNVNPLGLQDHAPAVKYNGLYTLAYYLNYNVQPPEILGEYPVYVMDVDEDAKEIIKKAFKSDIGK